jgi:hypothetical protein
VREDTLVCRLPRKTLTVTAPGELLGEVLDLCDGRRRWEQVMAQLGQHWAPHSVRQFLSGLSAQGAIVEAGEALARWSEIGQIPLPTPRPPARGSCLASPAWHAAACCPGPAARPRTRRPPAGSANCCARGRAIARSPTRRSARVHCARWPGPRMA